MAGFKGADAIYSTNSFPSYPVEYLLGCYVLMASDVYIEDVYDTSGNKISDETSVATSFTVRVTAEEVPQINAAVSSGDILLYLKTDSCL